MFVEKLTKTCNTIAGEDAEDVSLMFVELWWRISTEDYKLFSQESLYSSQAQMCQLGAVVQKYVYALSLVYQQWSDIIVKGCTYIKCELCAIAEMHSL